MRRAFFITTTCLFLVAALCPLSAKAAQKCKDSIIESSPESDYLFHSDGTVTQKKTGLMWVRCSVGQQWDGSVCKGEAAIFTWAEALNLANLEKFAGYDDWRLPNKNQLESIVEGRCVEPSVALEVFPSTQSAFYWTSSPYAGLGTGAWSVDFGYGVVTATEKSGKLNVRLVRDSD